MTSFTFMLADALEKVLPVSGAQATTIFHYDAFANDCVSFQLAYYCQNDDRCATSTSFLLQVQSDIPSITVRQVGLVPCDYPCHGTFDENYLFHTPGLYPDALLPLKGNWICKAVPGQWRSLWFTCPISGLTPGLWPVTLSLCDGKGNLLESFSIIIRVVKQALPPATLYHTEWFHADCLADYYHAAAFSEAHWAILDRFIGAAAEHGVNTLLTPIFTPPLDTEPGEERTAVQLVGIQKECDHYSFDFTKLERWVSLCKKHGIPNLEMVHLFSQWGAKTAPAIYVYENGERIKCFGSHTPAATGVYPAFLQAFLPALRAALERMGMLEHTWFHISDEPSESQLSSYRQARACVEPLLKGCPILDALSSYSFYEQGIVEQPVVSIDALTPFLDHQVPHLWTYYCTAQAMDVPNRFIAMPSGRNRILGLLLYLYQIEGFLHWGFNFYNAQGSRYAIDPFRVTDAGEAFPSGDAFLVYPGPDGIPYGSIRGEVLKQAQLDLRALQLYEARFGRKQTLEQIHQIYPSPIDMTHYPTEPAFFQKLRSALMKPFLH